MLALLTAILFVVSFVSGMLGIGVAIAAVPVLGLFGYALKDVVQPWALLLNALTALSAGIVYWRAGLVDKREATILAALGAVGAPIGVWLLRFASTDIVWWIYTSALLLVGLGMLRGVALSPRRAMTATKPALANAAAAPISVFAGFLGVGPGFLLVPALTMAGYSVRVASATNSVAVTLPSLTALAGHMAAAHLDWPAVAVTSVAATVAAWLGARFMSSQLNSALLVRIFGAVLLALALERGVVLAL